MRRFIAIQIVIPLTFCGCGRQSLPANATPVKDFAEAEARFNRLTPGIGEDEIAAFMGKGGFAIAGYSSWSVKRMPSDGGGAVAANETSKYWMSGDATSAVHVIFGTDGKSRLIELLRITPMGPPPKIGEPIDQAP